MICQKNVVDEIWFAWTTFCCYIRGLFNLMNQSNTRFVTVVRKHWMLQKLSAVWGEFARWKPLIGIFSSLNFAYKKFSESLEFLVQMSTILVITSWICYVANAHIYKFFMYVYRYAFLFTSELGSVYLCGRG